MKKPTDGYLPKDIPAERCLLGSMLLDASLNGEFPGARDFVDPRNAAVAALIHLARERGLTIGAEAIHCLASERGEIDKIGGDEYLNDLLEEVPHGGQGAYYASRVLDLAIRRDMLIEARRFEEMVLNEQLSIAELIDHADSITAHTPRGKGGSLGLRMTCVADVEPLAVKWLWKGRLPIGATTLLVGNPGDGKSMTSIEIVATTTMGRNWPDGEKSEAGECIIMACEDDIATTIRPRLEAAGADLSKVHCIEGVDEIDPGTRKTLTRSVRLDIDLQRLDAEIEKRPGVRLAIIDPISEYLGRIDSHKNAEVRGVLSPLAALAAKRGIAILLITHMSKGSAGGPALYRAMGSLAFTAQARVAWCHVRDADDPDRILWLPLKNNLHKRVPGLAYKIVEPGRIEWQAGDVDTSADEAMASTGASKAGGKLEKAKEWIRQRLADGKEVESDLLKDEAKGAGFSFSTHKRAKDELGVQWRRGAQWEGHKFFCWLAPEQVGPHGTLERVEQVDPQVTGPTGPTNPSRPTVPTSSRESGGMF